MAGIYISPSVKRLATVGTPRAHQLKEKGELQPSWPTELGDQKALLPWKAHDTNNKVVLRRMQKAFLLARSTARVVAQVRGRVGRIGAA